MIKPWFSRQGIGRHGLMLFIGLFLLIFLIIPIAQVFYRAFSDVASDKFTLVNFMDFFHSSLFMSSLYNSFYVSVMSVIVASIIAIPLAYYSSRFQFKGRVLIQGLGFLPLIMPPFVGAVAMQLLFGDNGSVNLFLLDNFGFSLPFMSGLNGVIFVEGIHYFPLILLNLSAALGQIDRTMEETAQNLGSRGLGLFRKIIFPLAMPGFMAGVVLVFIKVFDDLGTPLLLNVTNMLAPQAFLRITSVGIDDPTGYVIGVILVAISLLAMGLSSWMINAKGQGKSYATHQKGGQGLAKRRLSQPQAMLAYSIIVIILLLVLSPHVALIMLSFASIWSYSILPDGYTLAHYVEVFTQAPVFLMNTLVYGGSAALIDIVLAICIVYLAVRNKSRFAKTLDYIAMTSLAVPGLVLAIGYLRSFSAIKLPGGQLLSSWWGIIIIALAIRRLPYALRACSSALQQVPLALEQASENLGASRLRTVTNISLPLMMGGIVAAFMTCFATAAVELSTTLMLISSERNAPISYGIYLYMQSASGRGAAAALGVLAVFTVALTTYIAYVAMAAGRTNQQSRV